MSSLPPIVATANIVLDSILVNTPPSPSHTYLGMSRALLAGVQPLAAVGANASIALAFVAAQVAECSLKAYLIRSGNDQRLMKRSLRHNLEDLWRLAQSEGLPLSDPPPAWLLNLSHLHNAPYFIRYSPDTHALVTPAGEPMATELADLVGLVAKHI